MAGSSSTSRSCGENAAGSGSTAVEFTFRVSVGGTRTVCSSSRARPLRGAHLSEVRPGWAYAHVAVLALRRENSENNGSPFVDGR